jgi:hypothetical protein
MTIVCSVGTADVLILAGQYRFGELCSVSRLDTWRDTHLYRFSNRLDYINKQKPILSGLLAVSFSTYNFALIFDITIVKK